MKKKDLLDWWGKQKGRKENWLLLLLIGLLFLVAALPMERTDKEDGAEERAAEGSAWTEEGYVETLEARLERALEQVQGVGKVTVMITLSSTAEKVVEKDREITSESSSAGGNSTIDRSSSSRETAVYSGSNGEVPYVSKQLSPQIQGVLVIAQGGDDPVASRDIIEAVQALFGVDTHKIKVMKSH